MSRALFGAGVRSRRSRRSRSPARSPTAPTVMTFFAVPGLIVPSSWRTPGSVAVVAGGEHLDHLPGCRGVRAGVAHELVVPASAACRPPVVAAGCPRSCSRSGPRPRRRRRRSGVVEARRRRRAVAVEELRDADPRERRDAEAVVEARRVLVRGAAVPVVAGGDRRDVGPVAGAVARVGVRRVVGHVGDAAVQVADGSRVGGGIGAVVEAAVGDVDREVEGVGREARRRSASRGSPGSARGVASGSRDDLRCRARRAAPGPRAPGSRSRPGSAASRAASAGDSARYSVRCAPTVTGATQRGARRLAPFHAS